MKIIIYDEHGGFGIIIGDKTFSFDDEDTREEMVEVFKALGHEDVEYEEVY